MYKIYQAKIKVDYFPIIKIEKRKIGKLQNFEMINKINRQFEILQAEKKRMGKMSQTFVMGSPLFQSYMGSINSVTLIANNISTSFIQILLPVQVSQLLKTNSFVISDLINKIRQMHHQNIRIKQQAQKSTVNIKTQNCTVCGQNIHQSNIRQTLITLQQNTRQQFQMAMEQFIKISEQPLFSTQENNSFEQQLHFQLSQREKILNTNCNRIEQFVQIMESTMADLLKLKNVQFGHLNSEGNSQFINANKISADVSNFLQLSFSKKLPPWIHKMFLRMMTSYLESCDQKKQETGVQTAIAVFEQQEIKQLIKYKKTLQKENKEINDELKQLKICYKRMEQLNSEYAVTIASMPRAIKIRIPTTRQIRQKSRKNSLKLDKSDSIASKQQSPRDEEDYDPINYSILDNDINDGLIIPKRKRNKNQLNLFPQIRKNKYENSVNKAERSIKASSKQLPGPKQSDRKREVYLSVPNSPSNLPHKQQIVSKKVIEQGGNKNKSNKKLTILKNKMGSKSNLRDDIKQQSQQQKKNSSKRKGKQNERTVKSNKSNNQQTEAGNREAQIQKQLIQYTHNPKETKLKKINRVKLNNINKKDTQGTKKEQQNNEVQGSTTSIYQLNDISDSINRLRANNGRNIDKVSQRQTNDPKNAKALSLEEYNLRHNSQQMVLARKISRDMTKQILNKRSSLHNSQMKPMQGTTMTERNSQNIHNKQSSNANSDTNNFTNNHTSQREDSEEQYVQQEDDNEHSTVEIKESQVEDLKSNMNNTIETQFHTYVKQEKLRHTENIELRASFQCGDNVQRMPPTMRKPQAKQSPQSGKPKYQHQSAKGKKEKSVGIGNNAHLKMFEALKSHHIIPKSVDYSLFSSVMCKVQQAENGDHEEKHYHSQSPTRGRTHRKGLSDVKSSCGEQSNRDQMEQAHKSVYGRLFLSRAVAYKYQQSMAKSYHKKILKQLNEPERDYCYTLYSSLCETKKLGRQAYDEFCSILRYPYQTLYNNFEVVNFVSQMSFDTFEYFFRKIVWIHRKCPKDSKSGVCGHIHSVGEQLRQLLEGA